MNPKTKYKTLTLTLMFPEGYHPIIKHQEKQQEITAQGAPDLVATKDTIIVEMVEDGPEDARDLEAD